MGLILNGDNLTGGGGSTRSIGEVIRSYAPLSDSNLHLLDGTLLEAGGDYDNFIAIYRELYSTNPNLFCTETEWQSSISSTGTCTKFVYTETSNITGIVVNGTTYYRDTSNDVSGSVRNAFGWTNNSAVYYTLKSTPSIGLYVYDDNVLNWLNTTEPMVAGIAYGEVSEIIAINSYSLRIPKTNGYGNTFEYIIVK